MADVQSSFVVVVESQLPVVVALPSLVVVVVVVVVVDADKLINDRRDCIWVDTANVDDDDDDDDNNKEDVNNRCFDTVLVLPTNAGAYGCCFSVDKGR